MKISETYFTYIQSVRTLTQWDAYSVEIKLCFENTAMRKMEYLNTHIKNIYPSHKNIFKRCAYCRKEN